MAYQRRVSVIFVFVCLLFYFTIPVLACGGLFCQNTPVLQEAENIIFSINDNDTLTATVQINYSGDAPNFSWVVPVPSIPEINVADADVFDELQMLTDPIIIAPQNTCPYPTATASFQSQGIAAATQPPPDISQVEILAEGSVGPYDFHVVTSEDREALIYWLQINNYRVDPPMRPLIYVYSDEGMVFLAMKLQPTAGVQDIQPIQMTYEGRHPMIPLRLTAVAAVENMSIRTWIFGESQVSPVNYAHPSIHIADLRADFQQEGGTNYMQLVDDTVDLYQGRAFITEYAMPSEDLLDLHPQSQYLLKLLSEHAYVTRFFGRMSPNEMTVDPSFSSYGNLPNHDNVLDASQENGNIFWGCEFAAIEIIIDPEAVQDGFSE